MRSFGNHLAQTLRAIAFLTLASTLPAAAETVEVAPGVQVTKRNYTAPLNEQPFFGFAAKSPEQKAEDDKFVTAIVGRHVGHHDETVGEFPARRITQCEIFLMRAHGGLQNLRRHIHEFGIDVTHQHHRPFGEAHHFIGEALVLDELEAKREGLLLRLMQDDFAPLTCVQDHMRIAQLLIVILEAAHFDRAA